MKSLKLSFINSIQSGYTLVEMLVVVAIIGIVGVTVVPALSEWIAGTRLPADGGKLVGALNLARMEAIKRSEHVVVAPASGTDWSTGLTVWVDTDRDGVVDGGEVVLQRVLAPEGDNTITSNGVNNVTFLSTGFISAASRFSICDSGRSGETGRDISVLVSGRVRTTDLTCS
jgi:type IV fimbrial biogenesis protein FimT